MRLSALVIVLVVAGAFSVVLHRFRSVDAAPAQEADQKGKKEGKEEEIDPAMAAWIRAGTPNENHKVLEQLAGEWTVASTCWMTPEGGPTESKGSARRKSIFGGRFIQEEFQGEFMGKPFDGLGFTGYDNMKKKYVSLWMDSMSTMFMTFEGASDASKKVFTFRGECPDPLTGVTKKNRSVLKIEGKDKNIFTMFESSPDGKEHKAMELVYTRK